MPTTPVRSRRRCHMAEALELHPVRGVGEVRSGADLAQELSSAACGEGGPGLRNGDVMVVTSKIVSKAEGRVVDVEAADVAAKVAIVEREAVRILRRRAELRITETAHGFVCANSGVDLSNVVEGTAVLLPIDPD